MIKIWITGLNNSMTIKNSQNTGFTLLELIVSISIMTLVVGSIAYFMAYSSRNYRNTNEEINLQMESQTILNQLNDLIIEAYNVKYSNNELTVYQKDVKYIITFDREDKELNFKKIIAGGAVTGNSQVFGRYVKTFSVVDTGADDSNKTIKISFELEHNKNSYTVDDSIITLRNQIKPVS